jgi:CubicO group peptidase (beta-lactamase class C family)
MNRLFTAAFSLLVLIAAAQKSKPGKTDPAARFDAYITAAIPQWKVPGLSVAVVKNGKVALLKGYGVAEAGKPEPVTASTLGICASTTKAMTAVCMAMLVDEGKVSWNDKVVDVYPAFRLKNAALTTEITIKDLFTHNAGLGNGDLLWVNRYPADSIIYRMRYMEPAYSIRSSFIYQNLMYIVAGEVIHKVSGKPWQEFITQRLFRPLGLQNSHALSSSITPAAHRMAQHYLYPDSIVRSISYKPYDEAGAAGGAWSNAEDMSKWLLFLLDSTKIGGKPLLKPQTYAQLFKPQVMGQPYPTAALVKHHWDTYGLGWFQHDFKGRVLHYHTGSLAGATAIAGLVPEENFGIFIFGNLDHAELRHALLYKAIDLFCFNDDTRDYSKEFLSLYAGRSAATKALLASEESSRVPNTRPTLPLKEYTGVYENEAFGTATVTLINDSLKMTMPGEQQFMLGHWHYDTFKAKSAQNWSTPIPLQFTLSPAGKPEQLRVYGAVYRKTS